MKTQRQFLLMVLLAIFALVPFSSASAEQFIANITLKQGERTRLNLSSAYQSIMTSYGSGLPYSWWSDNSNVCTATSYRTKIYCEIFGNSVGTTEIHYKGEYWSGSNIIEYTCYWFINVEPGEGGGGGGVTPSSDEDYALPEESWGDVGNYTISWYNKNQTEFTISTNKELAGMAYLVNNGYSDFSGKTIKIADNISMGGKCWLSIGSSNEHYFKGTFDGQGYTIDGLIIGKQNNNQQYYGFFGYLNESTIRNVILQGEVVVVNPTCSKSIEHYVGGLAGYSTLSTIENCKCEMPVNYSRNIQENGSVSPIYVGGLIGYGDFGDHMIQYCSHEGDIICRQAPISAGYYTPGTPYIGGIIGEYKGKAGIEYCENISSVICCEIPRHSKQACFYIYVGGIVARSFSSAKIKHCRSICNFDITHHGTDYGAHKEFYVGGITQSGYLEAIDCYSSVSKATFAYEGSSNNGAYDIYYYGIGGKTSGIANFSNSDVDIQTNLTLIKGYSGSTSFSSAQMRTPAFLEELNMYSMLEMDGPVWTQDEGSLPYIAELHKSSLKGDDNDDGTVGEKEQCAKPTIAFQNGKISFSCETEGVTFCYKVTTPSSIENEGSEFTPSTKYIITVYAKKDGYLDSEPVTQEIDVRGLKGDVNDDGEVDIADAVKIVNLVVGKIDALSRPAKEVKDEKEPQ